MREGLYFGQPRASSHSKAQRKTLETTAVTPITRKKNHNKTVIHSCIGCFESSFRFLNLLVFSTNQLIVRILSINWSREFVTIVTNSNFNCLLVVFVLRKICMRAFSRHFSRHLCMLFLSRNCRYSLILISINDEKLEENKSERTFETPC